MNNFEKHRERQLVKSMKIHSQKNLATLASVVAMTLCATCSYANLAGNYSQGMDRVLPSGINGDTAVGSASAGDGTENAEDRNEAKKEESVQLTSEQMAKLQKISSEKIEETLSKGTRPDGSQLTQNEKTVLSSELLRRLPDDERERLQNISTEELKKALIEKKLNDRQKAILEAELVDRASRTWTLPSFNIDGFSRTVVIQCSSASTFDFARQIDLEGLIRCSSNLVGKAEIAEDDVEDALKLVESYLKSRLYFLCSLNPREESVDGEFLVYFDEGSFGNVKIDVVPSDEWWLKRWLSVLSPYSSAWGNNDEWFSAEQIKKRYFSAVNSGERFDYGKLRDALFNVNSQPDLTVNTDIKAFPTNNQWKADVDLTVAEQFPFHALLEINNYGMEEVEEWQTALTLQYLNLTKHDDVLTLSPAISFGGELFTFAGSYMMPHYWWRGGNTTLYGGYSRLDVDNIVPRLDLEGSGWFAGLQHSEYLLDDDKRLLAASLGLLWRTTEDQYTAYSQKLKSREASILPLSVALSYTEKKRDGLGGRNFATAQFLYNVMNAGDKLNEMWTDADKNYWIFRWQMARLQPLQALWGEIDVDHQWLLFLRLEGQYTTDTLIPIEKLSLGGYNCMRGYHARGYLGDYGVYGTVELRTPILVNLFSSVFGATQDAKQYDRLQFLGFVDWGWTAFNDLPSTYDDNEFIYSAGLGSRLSVTEYMQLKCDLAFPLRDTDWADDDDMEIYVSAQFQF